TRRVRRARRYHQRLQGPVRRRVRPSARTGLLHGRHYRGGGREGEEARGRGGIMAEPFQFELVSPEQLLPSEPVDPVVVRGSEGYFTVLKGHAPFMSTLRPGVIEVTRAGGSERIFVRGGFADVNIAGLTVLAEQAIPLAEIDPEMLAQDVRDAEE